MSNKSVNIRIMGLENHLEKTRDSHNGQGYDDFVRYYEAKLPNSIIARLFNVSERSTIRKWKKIHEEEING